MSLDPESSQKQVWCPLPWVHLSYSNKGKLRLCSHSRSEGQNNALTKEMGSLGFLENRNDELLKDVRKHILEGRWHTNCERCRKDCEASLPARNTREAETFSTRFDIEKARSITSSNGSLKKKPPLLSIDLRLGNKCNFKCVMCYPGESHLTFEDYALGTGESFFDDHGERMELHRNSQGKFFIPNSPYNWVDEEDIFDLVAENSHSLKNIFLAGGEPMLSPLHFSMLNKIAASGFAEGISLEYSTNLSKLPDPLPESWKFFKEVRVGVSIDARGAANEALRFGSDWNIIEANLRRLDQSPANIVGHFTTTVHLAGIEHLPQWIVWIKKQEFKKFGRNPLKACSIHPVYSPQMLSLMLLNSDEIEDLRKVLEENIENENLTESWRSQVWHQIEPVLKWAENSLSESEERIAKARLIGFFEHISQSRNQNWQIISPWFGNLLSKWESPS